MSSAPRTPVPQQQTRTNGVSRRPPTIKELADYALKNLWDPSKSLKSCLKIAEAHRKAGRTYVDTGDLESAFIEYAKAATIILEKLPTHNDYHALLNTPQRKNLGLNGQNILDSLSELKPTLVDRYERWAAQHPEEANHPGPSTSQVETRMQDDVRRRTPREYWRDQEPREEEGRRSAEDPQRRQRSDVESSKRTQEEAEIRQRDAMRTEEHFRRPQADTESKRKDNAFAAVTRAVDVAQQETSYYRRIQQEKSPAPTTRSTSTDESRREERESSRRDGSRREEKRRQQEEMKRREEEIIHQRRKREQEGILRRQEEADLAARVARTSIASSTSRISTPVTSSSQRSTFLDRTPPEDETPLPMPLESPTRYQPESSLAGRSISYPAPVTTTSPPPPEGPIRYPQLMSQHQLKQGYAPSLQSMFNGITPSGMAPSSLLFIPESSRSSSSGHNATTSNLYSSDSLPQPSAPVIAAPTAPYPYGAPITSQQTSKASYRGLSKIPQCIPPPPPLRQAEGHSYRTPSQESARIIRPQNPKADLSRDLKTVNMPRECLPRFLSVAALNTSRNRETCGLLLGRDKGHKYVVTTLLIPKQHSTSDTCTMDEEELVLQFTEERSLITLGWIHTHPSQSCFMSSVDLHTHSGFQRMLPESFAVVCAPKSTPNFGIFRLTDPPGLQTILGCNSKEAFHPHPDVPIYTDADKGHVQMKDMTLEIIDLRTSGSG